MSTDPYHAVQAEMQGTLANAGTLLSSFRRIRGMAVSTSGTGYPEEGEEILKEGGGYTKFRPALTSSTGSSAVSDDMATKMYAPHC